MNDITNKYLYGFFLVHLAPSRLVSYSRTQKTLRGDIHSILVHQALRTPKQTPSIFPERSVATLYEKKKNVPGIYTTHNLPHTNSP